MTHPLRAMSFGGLLKKTASHRWVLLYRLMTGQGPGTNCSRLRAIASLIANEIVNNLRMTYQLRLPGGRMKWRVFTVLWRWVSLWWFLPYYIYWELKWRERAACAGSRAM